MYRLSLPFALIVNDMPLGQLQSVIKSSKETLEKFVQLQVGLCINGVS